MTIMDSDLFFLLICSLLFAMVMSLNTLTGEISIKGAICTTVGFFLLSFFML